PISFKWASIASEARSTSSPSRKEESPKSSSAVSARALDRRDSASKRVIAGRQTTFADPRAPTRTGRLDRAQNPKVHLKRIPTPRAIFPLRQAHDTSRPNTYVLFESSDVGQPALRGIGETDRDHVSATATRSSSGRERSWVRRNRNRGRARRQ